MFIEPETVEGFQLVRYGSWVEGGYFSRKRRIQELYGGSLGPPESTQGLQSSAFVWNIKRILLITIGKEVRLLTGVQPSLSGELSGDGGSTTMLVTLQV